MKVERFESSIGFPRMEFRERGGVPIPARAWVKSVLPVCDEPSNQLDRGALGRRQADSARDEERARVRDGEDRGVTFLVSARSCSEAASREVELDSQSRSQ